MKTFLLGLKNNIALVRSRYFDIPENVRSYKSSSTQWSKREILGHLIDSARYNLMRFTEITSTSDIYKIRPYSQNTLVDVQNYQSKNEYELLNLWTSLNQQIWDFVSQMKPDVLENEIEYLGELMTFRWLVEDYLEHMSHHLNQIFDTSVNLLETPTGVTIKNVIDTLKNNADDKPFVSLLKYKDLEIEYYQPIKIDLQNPHDRDEIYVIHKGSGEFQVGDKIIAFNENDVLYVKALDEHRFLNFTDDFATWVIFYGSKV